MSLLDAFSEETAALLEQNEVFIAIRIDAADGSKVRVNPYLGSLSLCFGWH